ncbi:MAG: polysaccharide biosynthesis/export family protein [Flavobacteriaceae bacterium]|nr:polysaccharide biosynthesis/export family protein [Flavobacteriaceae bacterium]
MKFFKQLNWTKTLLLLVLVASVASCGSRKEVVYFQDAKDFETVVNTDTYVPKLKVDDIVDIHISVMDMEATRNFNLTRSSRNGGGASVDYLIDKNGEIDYPVLGKIKLAGLSIEEAKKNMHDKLLTHFKDPIVNIRIKNFSVTILGEVNRPGAYPVNGERISILEAIGMAGDLTLKGKRNNIMVIRDFEGTKVYTKIDLTSKEAFNSPVFYLTQNDIVYIEPNKSAVASASIDNRLSIAVSILSVLITSAVVLISRN